MLHTRIKEGGSRRVYGPKKENYVPSCLLDIAGFLYAGKTLRQAGRSMDVSDSIMQNHRRKVAAKVVEFMGADILRDIALLPQWKIGLDCERELTACRADRRH